MDFVYFVEFVPTAARGYRAPIVVLFGIMAFFYMAAVWATILPSGWRNFVAAAAIPYAMLAIGRLFWRWESPRFLMTKGRREAAQYILSCMASKNGTQMPLGQLQLPPAANTNVPSFQVSSKQIESATQPLSYPVIPIVTVSALFFLQSFSYYALTFWFNSFSAMKEVSLTHALLLIGFAELPGLAATTVSLEYIGRRTTLMVNFIGSALCTGALYLFGDIRSAFLALFGLSYFFIVGNWTSIYVTTPEMLPTSCRATAFSIAGACGKIAGMVSPLSIGWILDRGVHPSSVMALIAGCFLAACLMSGLLLVETHGINLLDV